VLYLRSNGVEQGVTFSSGSLQYQALAFSRLQILHSLWYLPIARMSKVAFNALSDFAKFNSSVLNHTVQGTRVTHDVTMGLYDIH
jgi:hypothetical protein